MYGIVLVVTQWVGCGKGSLTLFRLLNQRKVLNDRQPRRMVHDMNGEGGLCRGMHGTMPMGQTLDFNQITQLYKPLKGGSLFCGQVHNLRSKWGKSFSFPVLLLLISWHDASG